MSDTEAVILGLFCADRVIKEQNGKTGIIGIFDRFNIRDFAKPVPPFYIYISLKNLEGKKEFAVNLVSDDLNVVPLSIGGEFNSPSPENVVELVIPVSGVLFKKQGKYTLSVSIGSFTVGSRTITVDSAKPETDKKE